MPTPRHDARVTAARRKRWRRRAANTLLTLHLLTLVGMKVFQAEPGAVALVAALIFVTLAVHAYLTRPDQGPGRGA